MAQPKKKKKKQPRQKSKAAQATADSRGDRTVARWERAVENMDGVEFEGSDAAAQAIDAYRDRSEAERRRDPEEVQRESRKMYLVMGVIVAITMVVLVGSFLLAGK